MMFRAVILMMEAVRTSETSVDNHFTRQYNPEDSSEHQTTLLFAPCFCFAQFPNGTRTQDCFMVVTIVSVISSKQTTWSLRHFSIFLSLRATEPPLPGLEFRTVSQNCGICLCSVLFEKTTLALASFFYRPQFPNYRKNPHLHSNSGHF
jgi:hypothetical protein